MEHGLGHQLGTSVHRIRYVGSRLRRAPVDCAEQLVHRLITGTTLLIRLLAEWRRSWLDVFEAETFKDIGSNIGPLADAHGSIDTMINVDAHSFSQFLVDGELSPSRSHFGNQEVKDLTRRAGARDIVNVEGDD